MSDLAGGTLSFNWSPDTNQTVDTLAPCEGTETSGHQVFIAVYSLVFLAGVLLNGLTLKVYFCGAVQQTSRSVTVYLKNLAAADFFISLCLPIRIAHLASSSILVHQVYCNFGAAAFYLNMYASILFMGFIAANRYQKIVHPLGTHVLQMAGAARIISTLTWLFLLTTTSAYIILSLLRQKPVTAVPATASCDDQQHPELTLLYRIIQSCSAAIFLLVLLSLVFFYYSTSCRLAEAQQRQAASSGYRKLVRSRRNMLVLVSVFCVCFVPYHLIRLPYTFLKKQCSWSLLFFYLKELTVSVSVFNVCLDPLIYFIFCKGFRAQLSVRRASGTVQLATYATEYRNAGELLGNMKTDRKTSLTSSKPTNLLQPEG
ncbi:P2Y purinoceptor 14-like [Aulostomus maculatus]